MIAAGEFGVIEPARAQASAAKQSGAPDASASFGPLKQIEAGALNIGYAELGPADGPPVLLLHGWPYEGDANGAPHPDASAYARKFSGRCEHRLVTGGIGHNLPQEAPKAFAQAVIDVSRT